MEDDFYATIKFKNGEEIFAKVAVSEEENRTMLVLSNPVMATEVKAKGGLVGYKVEPWLKTCLLYTSPSPRDKRQSRMPSSA